MTPPSQTYSTYLQQAYTAALQTRDTQIKKAYDKYQDAIAKADIIYQMEAAAAHAAFREATQL